MLKFWVIYLPGVEAILNGKTQKDWIDGLLSLGDLLRWKFFLARSLSKVKICYDRKNVIIIHFFTMLR